MRRATAKMSAAAPPQPTLLPTMMIIALARASGRRGHAVIRRAAASARINASVRSGCFRHCPTRRLPFFANLAKLLSLLLPTPASPAPGALSARSLTYARHRIEADRRAATNGQQPTLEPGTLRAAYGYGMRYCAERRNIRTSGISSWVLRALKSCKTRRACGGLYAVAPLSARACDTGLEKQGRAHACNPPPPCIGASIVYPAQGGRAPGLQRSARHPLMVLLARTQGARGDAGTGVPRRALASWRAGSGGLS
eukprot:364626-Chlamydomonas_euryale.AAC.5